MFNVSQTLSDFHAERLLLSPWQSHGPDQKSKALFVANIGKAVLILQLFILPKAMHHLITSDSPAAACPSAKCWV